MILDSHDSYAGLEKQIDHKLAIELKEFRLL